MNDLDERVQILRRLRRYLEQQRNRFASYLDLLDRQDTVIRSGEVDRLRHYVELEQAIITDILTIQRAIDPLEELYRRAYPLGDPSVSDLKSRLRQIREQAVTRNEQNRLLLQERLECLRLEIKEAGRRGRVPVSPFARIGEPKLVDIRS